MKLEKEISEEIISLIDRNKTYFGNNKILNSIVSDENFIYELADNGFKSAKNALLSIESIDGVDESDDIKNILSKLISDCQKIEEDNKDYLEKLCYNIVIDYFGVPKESIEIIAELQKDIRIENQSISINKIKGKYKFDSIKEAKKFKIDCDKRRILNALCVGAGMYISELFDKYEDEINKVDSRLLELYNKILALNKYLLFCEKIEITDKDPKLGGICEVYEGNYETLTSVHSKGIIFPILLSETIRGVMESFINKGFNGDKEYIKELISKCDYVSAEPWDMIIGPELWKILSNEFKSKNRMIPYWINEIASLNQNLFSKILPEILSKTKTGSKYTKLIYKKAIRQFDKDNFSSQMSKLSLNKNIVTDNKL